MHFVALLTGNFALALGPWFVRIADSGPVSAGLWRLFLALPLLALFAKLRREPLWGYAAKDWWILVGAGVVFALDLASWHVGIEMTRLGNATLFGNSGSVILMIWGLIALHRRPHLREYAAVAMALGGAGLLLGRSMEIDARTLIGDLFCILAGLFYVVYILMVQNVRTRFGSWSLLFWSSVAGVPVMLFTAITLGEPVLPANWWPLIGLMFASQILGQGLLVYSLGHSPRWSSASSCSPSPPYRSCSAGSRSAKCSTCPTPSAWRWSAQRWFWRAFRNRQVSRKTANP